ncbi:GTP-binding protein [Microbacterium sp.]|uniref:GTP-binding protein n=1 Tax=Microbacterium sp. TaxID=51671 RepID=UPI0039E37693
MEQVDVVAVVGSCAPERARYARRLAQQTRRMFVSAHQLAVSPDPIDEAAALAAWADTSGGAVIEFPAETEPTELIGTLAAPDAATRLIRLVCVADAAHLRDDLDRESYAYRAAPPWRHADARQYIARAALTVTQIEYASDIVLVNGDALPTEDLSTIMALVSHLSPRARLRLHREVFEAGSEDEPYGAAQERPGWVAVLNGDLDPCMTDPHVSALRYDNVRPLHPGRLKRLLDDRIEPGEFGTVIRSGGFCRFATRSHVVAQWEHVGRMISFHPVARDDDLAEDEDLLALGQELAIIGVDLNRAALTAALDEAALDDAELADGPAAWAAFADPFPVWPTVADRAE